MVMVDAVECRRQVRVKYPCAARVLPLSRLIDSLDRVMAATARPESIGSRFETCFPLGFQRVDGQSLNTSVGNHGNSERALSPIGFPDVHTLDGVWSPRVGPVLQPVDQVSAGLWSDLYRFSDRRGGCRVGVVRHLGRGVERRSAGRRG